MKVALCYFGLVRGFKYNNVYESHKKYIYDILKKQNIDFTVYISTYDKDYDQTNIDKIPNLIKINKQNDEIISQKILQISDNFTVPQNYTEELKQNLLKCWYSQQDLYNMLKNSGKSYDLIIVMDIAQLILNEIDDLNQFKHDYIYVPNFAFHLGYCGRMLIGNMKNILFFLNKFNFIQTFKINIHPESFYKYYIEQIGKIQIRFFKIKFWRCRTNGMLVKDI